MLSAQLHLDRVSPRLDPPTAGLEVAPVPSFLTSSTYDGHQPRAPAFPPPAADAMAPPDSEKEPLINSNLKLQSYLLHLSRIAHRTPHISRRHTALRILRSWHVLHFPWAARCALWRTRWPGSWTSQPARRFSTPGAVLPPRPPPGRPLRLPRTGHRRRPPLHHEGVAEH